MLNFLDYLKDYEKEDVSKTEKIVKERWDKTIAVIKEAFEEKFTNKEYAIHKIQNDFTKKTPTTIDGKFLKENMNYVVGKINELTEGEIKIIINNDVNKGPACGGMGGGPQNPVVVTGAPLDIEMENTAPKKRGRPSTKVQTVPTNDTTTVEIINTNDETVDETVEESAEVLEERKKKAKKAIEDKEEKTKACKKACKDTEKETTNEETNMKTNNTISWQDIAGFEVESIKEDTLPSVKAKDKITVDGKTYQVEEVIPNAKTPSLTVLKVSAQESFVLGEIDGHEAINEEEEIQPAAGEEGMDAGETVLGEPEEGETEEHEAGETSEEEAEEHEGEPEVGDKVVVDEEKYLVTKVDEDEKEITVEDEDGEEQTFKFDDVEEIEKSEENKKDDEEGEEGEEGESEGEESGEGEEGEKKEEVAESYDPDGDSIHDDISNAKRLLEAGMGHSEGMPKMPAATAANAKGGAAMKHNMPQAQGAPKMTNGPVTTGKSATTHNMPQAQGMPKTTGVGVKEMEKKAPPVEVAGMEHQGEIHGEGKKLTTGGGYTQAPMKHTMPQADGMPKAPAAATLPKGGTAMKHNMPQAQGAPKMTNGPVTKGTSVTTHNMPQAQGMPKTTGVGVREEEKKNPPIEVAGDDPSKTFIKGMKESYISRANRFLAE